MAFFKFKFLVDCGRILFCLSICIFLLAFPIKTASGEIINSPPSPTPNTCGQNTYCDQSALNRALECVETSEILFENNIYSCVRSGKAVINGNSNTFTVANMKYHCWNSFNAGYENGNTGSSGEPYSSGINLNRKIEFFEGSAPNIDYTHPCKLKPKDSCNINVPDMVKAAFAHKFPYDILGDNPFPNSSPSCPIITIMSEIFPACWLLNLVKGLKYPLLLIFVFGALTRL